MNFLRRQTMNEPHEYSMFCYWMIVSQQQQLLYRAQLIFTCKIPELFISHFFLFHMCIYLTFSQTNAIATARNSEQNYQKKAYDKFIHLRFNPFFFNNFSICRKLPSQAMQTVKFNGFWLNIFFKSIYILTSFVFKTLYKCYLN